MTARTIGAGILGYAVLAATYLTFVLLARPILSAQPFDADVGGLTIPWMVALALGAIAGGLAGGWVCRRVGRADQAVYGLIAVLLGLLIVVVVTDLVVGPTPSARAFLGALFGAVTDDLPLLELLEGQPQTWFVLVSYLLAIGGIVAGARLGRWTAA